MSAARRCDGCGRYATPDEAYQRFFIGWNKPKIEQESVPGRLFEAFLSNGQEPNKMEFCSPSCVITQMMMLQGEDVWKAGR